MTSPTGIIELEEEIGRGAYGSVWRGTRVSNGDTVAVKVLGVDSNGGVDREVQILQRLQAIQSEFCVGYQGTYDAGDTIWIVMEYCAPGSVADLIRYTGGPLNEDQVQDVVSFVLLGLELLHANDVTHRDIKAGNILLTEDGRVKLADFGVAARLGTLQMRARTLVGAPFWMAPEVMTEQPYNHLCDIWSLGITVIEMAQGRPPFHDIEPRRAMFYIPQQPIPTLAHPRRWSPDMNDFVARCLVRDPARRSSAADLMTHPFVETRLTAISQADNVSSRIRSLVRSSMSAIERGRAARNFDSGSTQPSSRQDTLRTGAS